MDKSTASDNKAVHEAVCGAMNEVVDEAVGEARRGGRRFRSVPSFPLSRFCKVKLTKICSLRKFRLFGPLQKVVKECTCALEPKRVYSGLA